MLPITLRKPAQQQALEGGRLVLLGLLQGVALALLACSLAHRLSLRDPLFAVYALMLALAIPAPWRLERQGDHAALYMLVGWCGDSVGAITIASLLRGWLPATWFRVNLFQWATLVEMLLWLRVLSLHIEAERRHAERNEL